MHHHLHQQGHRSWVKWLHWLGTISFLLLLFTGIEMVLVNPRFYWGETGNDLTPALFEIPIGRNYHHDGWAPPEAFYNSAGAPNSSWRTYNIFNENGWGRSLHFLSGWLLLLVGLLYFIVAFYTRHIQRNLLPRKNEMRVGILIKDVAAHFRSKIKFIKGPQYGLLQKITYLLVLFIMVPLMVLTGVTMSPAVVASYPFLLTMFGGVQSARTLHFILAVLLVLFLAVHIIMIIRSGFKKHMLAMTVQS